MQRGSMNEEKEIAASKIRELLSKLKTTEENERGKGSMNDEKEITESEINEIYSILQRGSMNEEKEITESKISEMLSNLKTTEENERGKGSMNDGKEITESEINEIFWLRNKDNVGKRQRSRIVDDRKKAVKRSAHSGSKRKRSLKHEPRFYDFSRSEHKPVFPTEIPVPRLKELAAKLVDSYSKREGLDFELVEVVKGFSVVRDDTSWHHLNFKAKLKDPQPTVQSSDVKFFFGELKGERMPICCIIDPNDPHDFTTVCNICDGKEQVLLHPRFGTLSMFFPPALSEIHATSPSIYELELIEVGGSEEKAYRDFMDRTCALMAGF